MKNLLLYRMVVLVTAMMCALGASAQEAYACYTLDNTTLTFYYDDDRNIRPGTTYFLNTDNNDAGWDTDGTKANVTRVVFDPSFADARPTTTYGWFYGMTNLQSVEGLEHLNTSQVTRMDYMFYDCYRLTNLDLSHFNTAKVTRMSAMFSRCSGLTTLDLRHFNTATVDNMEYMFNACTSLRTIYVSMGWSTAAVTGSINMFYNCTSLVGGQGTTYDSGHVDAGYAHLDGGTSNPGYFTELKEAYACYTPENTTLTFYYDGLRIGRPGRTYDMNEGEYDTGWDIDETNHEVTKVVFDPSFADARPTTTWGWFYRMWNLESIQGLTYLNTSEVTIMAFMFDSCNKLTSLDLSSFNTSQVYEIRHMFIHCNNLRTIYVGDGWTTASMRYTWDMFKDCTSLVGGQGTTYDASHVDVDYAHLDGGPSNPGYFTEKPAFIRGDVNGDVSVNISDVTALINILLSNQAAPTAADCDQNGTVNISDVTCLINFLLSGTWPAHEMVYTVAGVESVFGSNWDPADNNNNMVKGADGVYTWTKTGVALTGNFEFKVVGDHDWSIYEWPIGMDNNYVAQVAEDGIYTIDITFNPEAEEANRITCTLTKTGDIQHVYTVVGTPNLFEADWDLDYPGNEMVKGADGIYRLNKAGWFQEGADIRFKVVQDHSYDHSWPAEDFAIGVYKTGAFNYEIVFNPYNNDEDKVHVVITEIF